MYTASHAFHSAHYIVRTGHLLKIKTREKFSKMIINQRTQIASTTATFNDKY